MSWRFNLKSHVEDGPVYEFGIFTGQSIVDISQIYYRPIKCFGFDSFMGLPKEENDVQGQDCWTEGNFSSMEHFSASSLKDCMDKIIRFIGENGNIKKLNLIQGFYCDSLKDEIVQKYNMTPASYIDIDTDLYTGTFEALDFMFRNNLVQEGTVIGYDDWGGTPGWKKMEDGESRAHREITEKYNVKFKLLFRIGDGYPHVQTAFKVL